MGTAKRFTLCTLALWLLGAIARGSLENGIWLGGPAFGLLTLASVLGAPVAGYVLAVRRKVDVRRLWTFVGVTTVMALVPYVAFRALFGVSSPAALTVLLRAAAFLAVVGAAYRLVYRRPDDRPAPD